MEHWLSLAVLKSSPSDTPKLLISIPKRAVKLAVRRNRLKRVLREAVRRDPFFVPEKAYRLKVLGWPEKADLRTAQKTLGALHD